MLFRSRKNKGKDKIVDVTNIASSSTSTTSTPQEMKTTWVVRPKVATQEPTVCKTNYHNESPQHTKAKTEPQEPTPAKGGEPQEPVLPHDGEIMQRMRKLIFSKIQSKCSRTLHSQFLLRHRKSTFHKQSRCRQKDMPLGFLTHCHKPSDAYHKGH